MGEQQAQPRLLEETTLASIPGNEQQAMQWVAQVVTPLHLAPDRLEDLKTAVAEAVMNAMEHGNQYQPEKMVTLKALASERAIIIRIYDQGEGKNHPISTDTAPNLEAKLAGLETLRGWGLFLIERLVDEVRVINDEHSHAVELLMYRP